MLCLHFDEFALEQPLTVESARSRKEMEPMTEPWGQWWFALVLQHLSGSRYCYARYQLRGHGRECAGLPHSHTHTQRNVQLINNRNTNRRNRTEPGPQHLPPNLFGGGSQLGPVVDRVRERKRGKPGGNL